MKTDLSDDRLSLSAALFEITKDNARIPDPANPGFNTLGGEQRVRGVSVDVAGMVTERSIWRRAMRISTARSCAAPTRRPSARRSPTRRSTRLNVWANYRITPPFDAGFGARYVSEQFAQSAINGRMMQSYRTFDAMARYALSDSLALKVNVTNLTDEYYFEQLHMWHIVPAAGRTLTFAVNAAF